MSEVRQLVMYDVRGIQKYIFRTAKVKDAIGASLIIEEIIGNALKYAVNELRKKQEELLEVCLEWCNDDGVYPYEDDEKDIQVLYIGGGNAFVLFRSRELAVKINKLMSKFVLEQTYSLQLAIAMIDRSDNYNDDYKKLYKEMDKVKADMIVSKPIGALPIADIEIKTGYPLSDDEDSKETSLKKHKGTDKRRLIEEAERIIDNYVTKKGVDSNVAIVHIDGNNMGLRIRGLVENKTNYVEAVNLMRQISYNINNTYKKVFGDMKKEFEQNTSIEGKDNNHFIMEILVAGDDITYVCNAKIALSTVEYYSKEISQYVMYGDKDDIENRRRYGFSVCAGISYVGSHFPFYAGYEVAEACCESAKDRAKNEENKEVITYKGNNAEMKTYERIGNFVDFQICKNIHTKNLSETRRREYVIADGKKLLTRPYYIHTDNEPSVRFAEINNSEYSIDKLKRNIKYFQNEKNMPSSLMKKLRNTYSLGETQLDIVKTFMDSRGWKLPEDETTFFNDKGVAIFYDALEMTDYYVDVKTTEEKSKEVEVSDK